ncbi:uncharacterized protein C8orf76 homolog [Python bivittatus]|uniref:Uncharacterized protein C8orf76 homolog n=1 Tax=Python bivittatus TaxID=176946 RepID=A0A9F2R4U5_PYTBI|nr:uncharacterized protein C8orf76 homolog [Python bivittatus]
MALPFAFEESVFEEGGEASRGRGPLASPYSARRCEPEWFCEQVNCQDDLERVNVRKFRGDLAYKQQEFQKALQEYSSCLALVPPSNTAMRRDLKESQARCLAHLGKHEEALRIAENLVGTFPSVFLFIAWILNIALTDVSISGVISFHACHVPFGFFFKDYF